uniref:Uncharacterized protein n=1 Tax=Electrophorus electricus TaxID=8005 RepID=A0A4W4H1L0_ELEEL
MEAYRALRSGTWTELSVHIFTNSTPIPQSSVCTQYDLTLLTCLLVGSYRFCIVPLLAACYGKRKTRVWRSKSWFSSLLLLTKYFLTQYIMCKAMIPQAFGKKTNS